MIASIIISIIIVFGLFQYFDKQKYIHYISHDVNNYLWNLNRSVIIIDKELDNLLDSKKLSYEEAMLLDDFNENIYSFYLRLEDIAEYDLQKVTGDEISSSVNETADAFHRYFEKLRKKQIQKGETIQLNKSQLEQIQFIKETNKIWLQEVKDHLDSLNNNLTLDETLQKYKNDGYFEVYNRERVAIKSHWVTLIKNLSDKTEDHQSDIFPSKYHSLKSFLKSSE